MNQDHNPFSEDNFTECAIKEIITLAEGNPYHFRDSDVQASLKAMFSGGVSHGKKIILKTMLTTGGMVLLQYIIAKTQEPQKRTNARVCFYNLWIYQRMTYADFSLFKQGAHIPS